MAIVMSNYELYNKYIRMNASSLWLDSSQLFR